jgi:hypothetical protein
MQARSSTRGAPGAREVGAAGRETLLVVERLVGCRLGQQVSGLRRTVCDARLRRAQAWGRIQQVRAGGVCQPVAARCRNTRVLQAQKGHTRARTLTTSALAGAAASVANSAAAPKPSSCRQQRTQCARAAGGVGARVVGACVSFQVHACGMEKGHTLAASRVRRQPRVAPDAPACTCNCRRGRRNRRGSSAARCAAPRPASPPHGGQPGTGRAPTPLCGGWWLVLSRARCGTQAGRHARGGACDPDASAAAVRHASVSWRCCRAPARLRAPVAGW